MQRTQPRLQRFARHLRRAERKIKCDGAGRHQDETRDGRGAPPPDRRSRGPTKFGRISRGDQAPRHLDAGRLRFRLADQTGGAIALNLVQLVAIDLKLAARLRVAAARQRPQHGEHRRRRHQRKNEPQGHETIVSASAASWAARYRHTSRPIVAAMSKINLSDERRKPALYQALAALRSEEPATSAALVSSAA